MLVRGYRARTNTPYIYEISSEILVGDAVYIYYNGYDDQFEILVYFQRQIIRIRMLCSN